MIVVSDTGPIHYLTLIGHVDVLPALFGNVIIPRAVAHDELDHPSTPEALRDLVRNPPSWLSIHENPSVIHPALDGLGVGERNAISLAIELRPVFLLCDDRAARHAAETLGLRVTGTLGIIEEAAVRSMLDFDASIRLLLDRTNFRHDAPLIQRVRQRYQERVRRDRSGFSLVELLVVIGIIGLLAAILMPALARARESAKTVQCAAQLRQVGVAIVNYATNNRGLTPAWSVRHEYPNDPYYGDPNAPDWSGPGWVVLLERYIGQKPDGGVFRCPAFPDEKPVVTYFMGARWMYVQRPLVRSISLGKIRTSSAYILSGDCTALVYYPPPFGGNDEFPNDDIDKDDGITRCVVFFGEGGGYNMHRQGNNILFGDGHVGTFKRFDRSAMTYSPHAMQDWDEVEEE